MWKVTCLDRPSIIVQDLKSACKEIIDIVNEMLKEGGLTYQVLETAMWAENIKSKEPHEPYFFYRIRDICVDNKWIDKSGKWISE